MTSIFILGTWPEPHPECMAQHIDGFSLLCRKAWECGTGGGASSVRGVLGHSQWRAFRSADLRGMQGGWFLSSLSRILVLCHMQTGTLEDLFTNIFLKTKMLSDVPPCLRKRTAILSCRGLAKFLSCWFGFVFPHFSERGKQHWKCGKSSQNQNLRIFVRSTRPGRCRVCLYDCQTNPAMSLSKQSFLRPSSWVIERQREKANCNQILVSQSSRVQLDSDYSTGSQLKVRNNPGRSSGNWQQLWKFLLAKGLTFSGTNDVINIPATSWGATQGLDWTRGQQTFCQCLPVRSIRTVDSASKDLYLSPGAN